MNWVVRKWQFRIKHLRKYAAFLREIFFSPPPMIENCPKAIVILDSYKRPWNMQEIVWGLLKCPFVEKVIVSNNNPEVRMEKWIRFRNERVEIIQHQEPRMSGERLNIARKFPSRNFIFIDDDLFLYPSQIKTLYAAFLAAPERLHGLHGELLDQKDGANSNEYTWSYVESVEAEVDVLNRVYLLSGEHVCEFFRLLETLAIADTNQLGLADDMVMSFCGKKRPECHAVGKIFDCYSTDMPDIAGWKEQGFTAMRLNLYDRLQKCKRREREL